jgi:succinate-acetate transporter protein
MEALRLSLLFLHFVGLAALLGGLLVQTRDQTKKVTPTIRYGVALVFIAGLALVGVLSADDVDQNYAKIGAKLAVAFLIAVLALANATKPQISTALWVSLLALTFANIGIALFWSPSHGSY